MNVGELTIKVDTSGIDEVRAKAEQLEAALLRLKALGVTMTVEQKPEGQQAPSLRTDATIFKSIDPASNSVRFEVFRLPGQPHLVEQRVMSVVLPGESTHSKIQCLCDRLSDALQTYLSAENHPS